MLISETNLPGVLVLKPKVICDKRGFFLETFRQDWLQEAGVTESFVQDNHSRSTRGVLRGLHYQLQQPQGKLIRVVTGAVFDVAVDIRTSSLNFGRWFGTELNENNMHMMYIPPGFAHGYLVLSESADFEYKCTDYYHPQSEQGILWNDPRIGIEWPTDDIQLSERDQTHPCLHDQQTALLLPT